MLVPVYSYPQEAKSERADFTDPSSRLCRHDSQWLWAGSAPHTHHCSAEADICLSYVDTCALYAYTCAGRPDTCTPYSDIGATKYDASRGK
jgi:hypothetical protein